MGMSKQIPPINRDRSAGVIKIHIGELVLKNFPAGSQSRIQDFVERELAAQLTAREISLLPSSERHVERIDGGSFPLPPDARANVVGREIAGSILRALRLAGEGNTHARDRSKT
jgi:hypothetical protein